MTDKRQGWQLSEELGKGDRKGQGVIDRQTFHWSLSVVVQFTEEESEVDVVQKSQSTREKELCEERKQETLKRRKDNGKNRQEETEEVV